jgi:hypothetical protein
MKKRTQTVALLGLCLMASLAVAADDPSARTAAAAPAVSAAPMAQAAADVAAQVAANPLPVRDDNAVVVTLNADGSSLAVPDASFMSTSVARLGPDGKLIIGCVNSREEYDAFFLADPLPAGPEVR